MLLIDTHIYLWFSGALNQERLREHVRNRISDMDTQVFISMASLWEMKIKQQKGLFKLSTRVFEPLQNFSIEVLPVEQTHILTLDTLDSDPARPIHRDPFDRIMLAQAIAEGLTFVTHDSRCLQYAHPELALLDATTV
ncbi:MAG: type II toxin-antitoxin system VapC family toxin [Bacteroidota bacterium]